MTTLHSNGYFVGKIPPKADFGDFKVILCSIESHKLLNTKLFFSMVLSVTIKNGVCQ